MKKGNLIILWHLHQPDYRVNGKFKMHWVYRHCIKNYYEMPIIALNYENLKVCFNITPILIEQILDYKFKRIEDPFLEILKKPSHLLTLEDKLCLLKNGFYFNVNKVILKNKRFNELYSKRGFSDFEVKSRLFSNQDYLDLQCLNLLFTFSESARLKYLDIQEIANKERFSEKDKQEMLKIQDEILCEVLDLYKKGFEIGKFEISISPFYHPIMPLLINIPVEISLNTSFYDDAFEQTLMAKEFFKNVFNKEVNGIWPSEGWVCERTIEIFKLLKFKWCATGEQVLSGSIGKNIRISNDEGSEELYNLWRYGDGKNDIFVFFRDTFLSDLIGFSYSLWNGMDAAYDLYQKINKIIISKKMSVDNVPIVTIILDGENPWEFYEKNGYVFLNSFYKIISEGDVNSSTFSDVLNCVQPRLLKKVAKGNWIDTNFSSWIGHPEKINAWKLLKKVRDDFSTDIKKDEVIKKKIYTIEGSDWFWWLGEDHPSPDADKFLEIFKSHIEWLYHLKGLIPPSFEIKISDKKSTDYSLPLNFISPDIYSKPKFLEWVGSGSVDLTHGTALPKRPVVITKVFFGYNIEYLFIRIDIDSKKIAAAELKELIYVIFLYTSNETFIIEEREKIFKLFKDIDGKLNYLKNIEGSITSSIVFKIKLIDVGLKTGDKVYFHIKVLRDSEEIESAPAFGRLEFKILDEDEMNGGWKI